MERELSAAAAANALESCTVIYGFRIGLAGRSGRRMLRRPIRNCSSGA